MSCSVSLTRLRALTSGLSVAAAIGIMNVTTYGLTLLAARWMGPSEFGQVSSVLGLLIVVNVLSLGLQATAARRLSTSPGSAAQIVRAITRITVITALAVLVGCLVAIPLVVTVLDLTSWWSAAMMGVTAMFLTIMGGFSGLLQGEERWHALSAVYITMGTARLVLGVGYLALSPTTASVMTGVAVAAALPAAVAWWQSRGRRPGRTSIPVGAETEAVRAPFRRRSTLRELAHSTHALLAFFALSNVDIILARVALPEHDAGLYAAGLILTKAMLFLPQFVVIVAFPAMARNSDGRRTHVLGLAIIVAMGASVCSAVAWLDRWALAFTGGGQYAEVQPVLWVFAALGTVLAMIQLLVYSALAQAHARAIYVLWAGLLVLVVVGSGTDTVVGLLRVKIAVDVAVLVVMLGVLLLRPGRGARPSVAEVSPSLAEDTSSPEQPAVR